MIKVKRLTKTAQLPTRGSEHAAGWDLYAGIKRGLIVMPGGSPWPISTGIAIEIPPGHYGQIAPRSGLAKTYGCQVLGGVIDSDYRGEVKVMLSAAQVMTINPGDRIAQLLILPVCTDPLVEVEELGESVRGDGSFGSTGR